MGEVSPQFGPVANEVVHVLSFQQVLQFNKYYNAGKRTKKNSDPMNVFLLGSKKNVWICQSRKDIALILRDS